MSFYCRIYYEAIDLIVESIRDRFDPPGYRVYQCLENLLLKAAKQEDFTEELQLAVSTYTSDIHESNLQMQLQTLGSTVHEKVNIFDVRDYRKKLTPAERLLLNEVTKLYIYCTYVCTVILFRLTTLHMIGNKLFYNNIIQPSYGAGTIVVLTTGFIQCKV